MPSIRIAPQQKAAERLHRGLGQLTERATSGVNENGLAMV
jgi:hypothetical protein